MLFRNYCAEPLFTDDYKKVRDFLIRINSANLSSPNFTWGRWEWMITHKELDRANLGRIGLWEDGGVPVAMATYETELGDAYFCLDARYGHLKSEMFDYAVHSLQKDGKLRTLIADDDRGFQEIAARRGFRPTQGREHLAAIYTDTDMAYSLPEGFRIASMSEGWDFGKYHSVMWRGFNRDDIPPQGDDIIAARRQMLSSPALNPDLVLAVIAPDGSYASHCTVWYTAGHDYAYVEPVATDPSYRKLGLAKAAVLEAVARSARLGAKQALVGSSQQFYYNIGFHPIHTETWWEAK